MPNHPITIKRVIAPNKLELTNHGNARTKPGDTVTWIVLPVSGVTITSILPKPGNPNVFNPVPAPLGGSPNWQGTIAATIDCEIEEDYLINYTTQGGSYTHDPKIYVNPTKFDSDFLTSAITVAVGLGLLGFSLLLLNKRKKWF